MLVNPVITSLDVNTGSNNELIVTISLRTETQDRYYYVCIEGSRIVYGSTIGKTLMGEIHAILYGRGFEELNGVINVSIKNNTLKGDLIWITRTSGLIKLETVFKPLGNSTIDPREIEDLLTAIPSVEEAEAMHDHDRIRVIVKIKNIILYELPLSKLEFAEVDINHDGNISLTAIFKGKVIGGLMSVLILNIPHNLYKALNSVIKEDTKICLERRLNNTKITIENKAYNMDDLEETAAQIAWNLRYHGLLRNLEYMYINGEPVDIDELLVKEIVEGKNKNMLGDDLEIPIVDVKPTSLIFIITTITIVILLMYSKSGHKS